MCPNSNTLSQNNMMRFSHHVLPILAVLMLFAKNKMASVLVIVSTNTKVTLTRDAALNVS
jgi:hypothetical protein